MRMMVGVRTIGIFNKVTWSQRKKVKNQMGEGQHNNAIYYALVPLWNELAILYKAIKSSYQ